jgi:hypothetical protein
VTAPRRSLRHRPRPLLEQARAPRPTWRLLFVLPLLFIFTLMGVKTSAAWFTSGATVSSPAITSGSFSTLMTLSKSTIALTGTAGNTYSDSITVTSLAAVDLQITAVSTSGGPSVTPSSTTIVAGGNVTFNLTGSYPATTWTGTLTITIGAGSFDSAAIPITLTPQVVDSFVDLEVISYACYDANGQKNVSIMNITKKPGAQTITYKVSVVFITGGGSLVDQNVEFQSDQPHTVVISTNVNNGNNPETSGIITITPKASGIAATTRTFSIKFKKCVATGLLLVPADDPNLSPPGQEEPTVIVPDLEEPAVEDDLEQSPTEPGDEQQPPADTTTELPPADTTTEQSPADTTTEQSPAETVQELAP